MNKGKIYGLVVDYFMYDEDKGEYTAPMYLGIAYPPKNLFVFDEEHTSRSFRWENKTEAEKYLQEFAKKTEFTCSFINPRIEGVK